MSESRGLGMRVDIDIGANVLTADGDRFGKVSRVVVSPDGSEVTHIVARRGTLFPADVVVPIDRVRGVSDHTVTLSLTSQEAKHMPPLEASAAEPLEVSDQDASGQGPRGEPNLWVGNPHVTLPPLLTTATNVQPYVVEYWRNVPEQSLVLRDGLPVRTRNGQRVGALDELVTDPVSHAVTDVVLRLSGTRGERKAVPIGWVERSDEEDGILLGVERNDVEKLPNYH